MWSHSKLPLPWEFLEGRGKPLNKGDNPRQQRGWTLIGHPCPSLVSWLAQRGTTPSCCGKPWATSLLLMMSRGKTPCPQGTTLMPPHPAASQRDNPSLQGTTLMPPHLRGKTPVHRGQPSCHIQQPLTGTTPIPWGKP